MTENNNERKISDADVKAIVTELRKEMSDQFYDDIGRGVWAAVKAFIGAAVLLLIAWGAKLNLTDIHK